MQSDVGKLVGYNVGGFDGLIVGLIVGNTDGD